MSPSFLDKTGLTYFWSKIKAYIASLGYASDSSVVHLTGSQTVDGSKTFTLPIVGKTSGNFPLFSDVILAEEDADLNDFTTPGSWFIVYNGDTGSIRANFPFGRNGFLVVFRPNNADEDIKQFFLRTGTVDSNDHQIAFRQWHIDQWSSWHKLYTNSDVIPIANGGTGSSTQNFVDLTTDQTVKGLKTLYGAEMDNYPEFSWNYNHSIFFRFLSRRDTLGQSCSFIKRYRQNTTQGATGGNSISIGSQENTTWKSYISLGHEHTVSSSAINVTFYFVPAVSITGSSGQTVTINKILGSSSNPWDNVYANSGPWSGSDERMKDDIEDLSDELLDAWKNVGFKIFRFRDAKAGKGSGARMHVGVVAQDVEKALAVKGLDAGRYGFFGYDKWDARYEDGSLVQEAGDRYSIRYEEALALECACLRRRVERLEARLAALEESSRV